MSSYASRMHVLKCLLLRNHSIQKKLQVLTVDIVTFLPNCSQRSQDWVAEYSEYSQCFLAYAPRGKDRISLKVHGNTLTWNPSQQNCIDSHVKVGLLNLIVRKWELRLRSLIHVIAETEHRDKGLGQFFISWSSYLLQGTFSNLSLTLIPHFLCLVGCTGWISFADFSALTAGMVFWSPPNFSSLAFSKAYAIYWFYFLIWCICLVMRLLTPCIHLGRRYYLELRLIKTYHFYKLTSSLKLS